MPKHPLSIMEHLAVQRERLDKAGPVQRGAMRADDWANVVSGFGVLGVDKRLGGSWGYTQIDQLSCQDIWRGDDMMDRIVTAPASEMIREGFEVGIEGEKELAEDADAWMRELRYTAGGSSGDDKLLTALNWARAYGGSGMLLGIDDGQRDISLPVREDRIKSFDFMTPFTPMELVPVTYYSDPLKPRFGEIATWRLTPLERPPGDAPDLATLPVIHESRIIRFDGEITSRGQMLYNIHPGWGDSIFVRLQQIISDFQTAWAGAGIIFTDFSTPVLKLKNLAQLLLSQDANAQTIQTRAAAIELARSTARTVIIDSEEEYERKTVPITGLPELLQQLTLRVASAARMPVSLLMGQAPAGLNATGDSDIRWYYDQVAAMQERKLRANLTRLWKLMFLTKGGPSRGSEPDNWCVNFHPLWQLTEAETTKMRLDQAQADQIYIQNQVLTPEEVAQSRFGGDAYSLETKIDIGLRNEVVALGNHQAKRLGVMPEDIAPPGSPPLPPIDATKQGPDNPDAVPPAKLNPALAASAVQAAQEGMPSPLPRQSEQEQRRKSAQSNPRDTDGSPKDGAHKNKIRGTNAQSGATGGDVGSDPTPEQKKENQGNGNGRNTPDNDEPKKN